MCRKKELFRYFSKHRRVCGSRHNLLFPNILDMLPPATHQLHLWIFHVLLASIDTSSHIQDISDLRIAFLEDALPFETWWSSLLSIRAHATFNEKRKSLCGNFILELLNPFGKAPIISIGVKAIVQTFRDKSY